MTVETTLIEFHAIDRKKHDEPYKSPYPTIHLEISTMGSNYDSEVTPAHSTERVADPTLRDKLDPSEIPVDPSLYFMTF